MSTRTHDEPAFPGVAGDDGWPNQTYSTDSEGHNICTHHSPGMTLRDWFAGQALATIHSGPMDAVAGLAYAMADAMLAERAKGTQ